MDIENIIDEERPESETLEYKDKRADNATVAEELVAFANNAGGTLLLGVREENDSIVELQHIENTGEREEGIQDVISSSVEPRLRVVCSRKSVDGNQLLVLSVEDDGPLRSIEINGRPVVPYRQGSRKDYLHGYELNEQIRGQPLDEAGHQGPTDDDSAESDDYDFSIASDWVRGVSRAGSLEEVSAKSPPNYSSPSTRLLTETAKRAIIVPSKIGIDPFDLDTLTYEVSDSVAITEAADLHQLVNSAGDILGTSFGDSVFYAIYYNKRQLVGRHLENFLEDNNRIDELATRMSPGSRRPSDPRPVGIITIPTNYGLLWVQVQWKDGQLRRTRGECGLLLPNIPFDQTPLREFFEAIGASPPEYKQRSSIQHLRLNASYQLENPEPVLLKSELEAVFTEVIADNPLYQQPEVIADAFEAEVPTRFCDAISSVNRLPFDVGGGWVDTDEQFTFTDMDILSIDAMFPAYVVDLMSHAKVE